MIISKVAISVLKLLVTAEQGHVVYNKILLQHYLKKGFWQY